jgi:cysteinyl-tRNA synthetase
MSNKYLGDQFDIHGGGMDLQFPHHECEIAQSAVVNHKTMANYWIHNNMITINGRKMGKSYNNVIKLSEMFTGDHPLLEKAYHPMTIRFFILQSHYRSTLDFGNEALKGAEKAFKRLWEAYMALQDLSIESNVEGIILTEDEAGLDTKVNGLLSEFDEFMNDDFNTAKVLASMFELAPIINGIKDRHISPNALKMETLALLKSKMKVFIEDIFGLKHEQQGGDKLDKVLNLIMELRKQSKSNKDFVTSDKIRNELSALGIQLKDEKDGGMSYSIN